MKRTMSACPFCHADTRRITKEEKTYECGSFVVRKTGIYNKKCSPKVKPCSLSYSFFETGE